jgi:ABC-type Fe3+-hydroxamate transport system substrate-binding protein
MFCDGILTRGSSPVPEPSHPLPDSDFGRLPAYSGATVPASHRLPAQNVEWAIVQFRASTLFLVALLAACAGAKPAAGGGIVTLVPSFADDVYALGAGGRLAAVSAFTDDPRAALLPRVSDASSVDTEAIVALRPALVLGIPSQSRLVEPLRRAGLRVVLLSDDGYEEIFSNLLTIGALTGHAEEARTVVSRLQRETASLAQRARGFAWHPRVFVVLQAAPIWTAGTSSYISRLVAIAGGRNAAQLKTPYAQYSAETLVVNQPDVLIADRIARLDASLDRQPWRSLRAVRLGRVYEAQPDLLERPGPQYNEAIRWLIARLEPIAGRPEH